MKVIAIDPGTSNTGVVCFEGYEVKLAKCFSFKEPVKDDQTKLLERASEIVYEIEHIIDIFEPDEVVVEGFVNFGVRNNVYTSQTPFLVGMICESVIGNITSNLYPVIQLSRNVLKRPKSLDKKDYPPMVEEALANVKNAKETCTNEHLRSALAHGYYYMKGLKNGKENHQEAS